MMTKSKLLILSCCMFANAFICAHAGEVNASLTTLNKDFHDQYNLRVQQIINTFGAPSGRPIMMNLGGKLIFKYQGQTEIVNINPSAYHILKTFAHATFSMFLSLSTLPDGKLPPEIQGTLYKIKKHLTEATQEINNLPLTTEEKGLSKRISNLTESFISNLLNENDYRYQKLNEYYQNLQPILKQAIKKATEREIVQLNDAVDNWLKKLTEKEQQLLAVVVATPHQARAEEVSLQYFTQKLHLKLGVGALHEKNLVVLEDKFDEASALSLLARHFLDREAAKIILQNEEGLQRDLLADAAAEILNKTP